ncbi:MAG: Gfo/Idh/MocA family oxidoreductase [Cyclobacteriaceae bacterium]|nr:Gfo/Idh/MocA family oxidoreductase [Cyclobacteriaceae bacterium]
MTNSKNITKDSTRRDFIKGTAVAVGTGLLAGSLPVGAAAFPAGSDEIKIALIGCGGRGTGAASDALSTGKGIKLVAMADAFEDRVSKSHEVLLAKYGKDQVDVPEKRRYVGFDAYKQAFEHADVVFLATPPAFRPQHFREAVEGNKHVFLEKPVAVDPAGVRHVIESGEMAKKKGLSVVAGTLYRRQSNFVEAIGQIHQGAIGQILGGSEYYMTGPIWVKPRTAGMTDMEYQMRNWYYFNWLSGDHIVEQFIHNLDVINWIMKSHPIKALATGGRIQRTAPEYGHIYDHFSVEFVYPGNVLVQATSRQMRNVKMHKANRIIGSEGIAYVNPRESWFEDFNNKRTKHIPKDEEENAYVTEHVDLMKSIREGKPLNEATEVAHSTLTGILGRESAYTGKELTWDEVYQADLDIVPKEFSWDTKLPKWEVPVPGLTDLVRNI